MLYVRTIARARHNNTIISLKFRIIPEQTEIFSSYTGNNKRKVYTTEMEKKKSNKNKYALEKIP